MKCQSAALSNADGVTPFSRMIFATAHFTGSHVSDGRAFSEWVESQIGQGAMFYFTLADLEILKQGQRAASI
jgi:hypothetical protein